MSELSFREDTKRQLFKKLEAFEFRLMEIASRQSELDKQIKQVIRVLENQNLIIPAPFHPSEWMTIQEYATYCKVSKRTVYAWIDKGLITPVRNPAGKILLAKKSAIRSFDKDKLEKTDEHARTG